MNEDEIKAAQHVIRQCQQQHKAGSSYLALMRGVKLRIEIEDMLSKRAAERGSQKAGGK